MITDTQGPPHELRPLLVEAVKALDSGVAIEPTSYFHEELKRLLEAPSPTSFVEQK
jgi:hypothetical protein